MVKRAISLNEKAKTHSFQQYPKNFDVEMLMYGVDLFCGKKKKAISVRTKNLNL